jgi:Bacterial regulatory protein, Fis family
LKVVIDFDAPDILPLNAWLRILKLARIDYELRKRGTQAEAARALGVSRATLCRARKFK